MSVDKLDPSNASQLETDNNKLMDKTEESSDVPNSHKSDEENAADDDKNRNSFFEDEIKWHKAIMHISFMIIGAYGFLTFPYIERYKTLLWSYFMVHFSWFGIGGCVHRYYCHRAYKATLPLQILLISCYLTNYLVPIRTWVLIHRCHHQYSDTEFDPHNSKRGFFFSHIGWLMVKRPRKMLEKLKQVNMEDINRDPLVSFVDRHFLAFSALAVLIPIAIPVYLWNETWYYASLSQFLRFLFVMNAQFSINSFAHTHGIKPYNKHIAARENPYANFVTSGEGWHNYHHSFPNDYRSTELFGPRYDLTARAIEFFEKIGWAYDLRLASNSLLSKVIANKGDKNLLGMIN